MNTRDLKYRKRTIKQIVKQVLCSHHYEYSHCGIDTCKVPLGKTYKAECSKCGKVIYLK